MITLQDECLKKYTTVKIGGRAKNLYMPESVEELGELVKSLSGKEYNILSGGSNVLINDEKTFENIIVLTKMDNTIKDMGNGTFYVGASVRVQKLINTTNKQEYGGIEYLYSVPALVGGAIAMNAGRGRVHGLAISDYIKDVHVYDNGTVKTLNKDQCGFDYRNSIFKNSNLIVVGATFTFEKFDENNPNQLTKQERMQFSKTVQDYTGPSFGSVFCQQDRVLMQMIRLIGPGYKDGMAFSKKTSNWLTNKGEGNYNQAINLINRAEKIHKLLGKKAVPEVIIWK
ncbi:FAD-binding protein [Sutcliffiella horikoshii]|uniref:FAD-binding protein n=1 Tax=Sutcliffiella horikoshii TaxID=79883 RepID=UPI00384B4F07